jgi:hypothetical protein
MSRSRMRPTAPDVPVPSGFVVCADGRRAGQRGRQYECESRPAIRPFTTSSYKSAWWAGLDGIFLPQAAS